jgi:biopolymer transport protein ExbB
MPDNGDPAEMTVVNFGSVFAYAVDNSGNPYLIRQTGKLGAERYAVEPVGEAEFAEYIRKSVPEWEKTGQIANGITIDVMQNANTGILVSGKKVDTTARIIEWFKAGGPVMGPLAILVIWGLILIILKFVQFSRKDKSNKNLFDSVAKMLSVHENDKAFEFAKKHKGVVAKVVTTCLMHSKWNRSAAEKAVKEILIDEIPQLDKHLPTLAVIAGAAPLLGLLGTVTGMISLFDVITNYGTGDPKILAGGISEALITTEAGLIIAIPVLLIHNLLRNRSNHIQSEMQKHAIRIINRLWPETE